jgi:glycosyltransferase involved in cell wall biosynthesis
MALHGLSMKVPKVTVLMSVFNGIDYLERAVESILNQSFRDFEFVIINDGSTQPVIPVIERYSDARVILINQENKGLTSSLNRGLSLSRGDYIARMDSDDISLPNRLEIQWAAMESDPNLDLVGSFYEVIDGSGKVCEVKTLIQDTAYRLWRLQFHNVYGHGTVMLRKRKVLTAGGYDEKLTFAQDYDLWSRLCDLDNTLIIPKVLYQYRLVDQGTQSSVAHYESQLANAARTSDRNLKRCNPGLSWKDCEEVRAVFWKFQQSAISERGLELLVPTLEGFLEGFNVPQPQRQRLAKKVLYDVIGEINGDQSIPKANKESLIVRLTEMFERFL